MFEDEKDWKECLAEEDQQVLAGLFEKARRHKCAYCSAEDVKVAQLWCALVEMKKEMDEQAKLVNKAAAPFRAIVEMGEVEKKKTIERLVRDMLRPEPDKEDATRKLVDSLMKF